MVVKGIGGKEGGERRWCEGRWKVVRVVQEGGQRRCGETAEGSTSGDRTGAREEGQGRGGWEG